MLQLRTYNIPFHLTLAIRFTGLQIKQASRNSIVGQCSLIKPECVKEREKREQEPENVLVSALWLFLLHVWEREREERERGGEQKESAKEVYNALKPVRHLLLYIKPVNSLVNVPMVPSTLPHSLFSIEPEITEADRLLGSQTDRQSQVQPQPALTTVTFSVSHTYMHTLVCRQTLPTYSASPPLPSHYFHLLPF